MDQPSKQQLAGELEKSISSGASQQPAKQEPAASNTPSAGAQATTPAEMPAGGKGTGQNFDPQTGKPISQYGQQQAGATPTEPAAQQGAPAAETPPAGTQPTATQTGGKMSQAQQDAMKAKLKGKRAAGQTTASQTGSGFSDYVAGSQNKLITNPDGSTSMKKLQRESIDFYSNFLGQKL